MITETSLLDAQSSPDRFLDMEPGVGTWQRPGAGDHRSPCPALNSLANGGYLPRSGEVTTPQLVRALHERLGLPVWMGRWMAKRAMGRLGKKRPDGEVTLDLADLAQHGFLEHDASLTRRDARDGDASRVSSPLVTQLLSLSEDARTLTLEDLAAAHQIRMTQSAAGGHRVSLKASVLGTFEVALLYQVLRWHHKVAVTDARELLERERIPLHVAPQGLRLGTLVLTAIRIALMGNLPFSRAAKRARQARANKAPAPARCPFARTRA